MLLEFTVKNYRSINKMCTLSMQAQSIEPKKNTLKCKDIDILTSAAIYGANSSGKSNIVNAILAMEMCVSNSIRLNNDDKLFYDPFLLSSKKDEPTFFEIIFIEDDSKFRYGFKINAEKVKEEWLYLTQKKQKRENLLFLRDEEGIGVNKKHFSEGIDKENNTNDNRLFLSLCSQLGGAISNKVMSWFSNKINIVSGLYDSNLLSYSLHMLHENDPKGENAKKFFNILGLGFKDIQTEIEDVDINKLPNNIPLSIRKDILKSLGSSKIIKLNTIHNVYDKNLKVINEIVFDLKEKESEGTQKLISLSGPIFDSLENGKVLIVDELDAKMHPLISQYIIDLFNDEKINKKGAQLIFTTHDTNLLSTKQFRRDQIYFTEKDKYEQTDLYNMMDIILPDGSKPRNDANYEKNYIAGRYGAIPFITNNELNTK